MNLNISKLNIITYLVPDIPVEIFETFTDYLEEQLDIRCNLIYESRWQYPSKNRDVFAFNDADMGFISTSGFLKMWSRPKAIELCPVAPVFSHPRGKGRAVIFSDLIIRCESGHEYKKFEDLKGHKLAYTNPYSNTGYLIVLSELKNHNTDCSFFSDLIQSGSHMNSIQLVLTKRADVAAVDSRILKNFFHQHPHYKKELKVLSTLGPMCVNPVVFRKSLPEEAKRAITDAILQMPKDDDWRERLEFIDIENIRNIDLTYFDMERKLQEKTRNMSLVPTYY